VTKGGDRVSLAVKIGVIVGVIGAVIIIASTVHFMKKYNSIKRTRALRNLLQQLADDQKMTSEFNPLS